MRTTRWLRYGLASTITAVAALGLTLVACGDDDTNPGTTPTPVPEASTVDAPQGDSTTGTDSGDGAVKPENAKIVIVNAATDFGPSANIGPANAQAIRICFGLAPNVAAAGAATITPIPPQPDQGRPGLPPGVYIGTGGIFKSFGLDLSTVAIVPYIMNARSMFGKSITSSPGNPGTPCSEILKPGFVGDGGATFTEGVDYWKLPPIENNKLLRGQTYALVLTGCAGDATETPERCGPENQTAGAANYMPTGTPGVGNLTARIYDLDRTTPVPADAIGTQFIHSSAPANAFLNGGGSGGVVIPVIPGYATDNAGSNFTPVPGAGDAGAVLYGQKTALKNVTGINVASDYFTANPQVPIGAQLPLVQAISFPSGVPDGGAIRAGAAFTFFAVGDPVISGDAGGQFNPRSFHYLAFPNNPPVENYVP